MAFTIYRFTIYVLLDLMYYFSQINSRMVNRKIKGIVNK